MFSVKNFIEDNSLSDLWKAAHGFEVGLQYEDDLPLQETCKKLSSLVQSDAIEASQRLSLRTSSTMAAGAARILRHGLDNLLEDAQEMIKDMQWKGKRHAIVIIDRSCKEESVTSSSSEPLYTSPILISKGSFRITSQNDNVIFREPFHDEDSDDEDEQPPAAKRRRLGL